VVTRGRGRGMGLALRAVLGPLIDVEQFVLPDHDDIAVIEVVVAHALGVQKDAVGAVEVLAYEAALDLQVVGGSAAYDQAARIERSLADGAASGCEQDTRQRRLGTIVGSCAPVAALAARRIAAQAQQSRAGT